MSNSRLFVSIRWYKRSSKRSKTAPSYGLRGIYLNIYNSRFLRLKITLSKNDDGLIISDDPLIKFDDRTGIPPKSSHGGAKAQRTRRMARDFQAALLPEAREEWGGAAVFINSLIFVSFVLSVPLWDRYGINQLMMLRKRVNELRECSRMKKIDYSRLFVQFVDKN